MAKDPKNFLLGPKGGKPPAKGYVRGLLYHVTPSERVEKIRKEGVRPQDVSDRKLGERRKDDDGVYAWTHPARAFAYAESNAHDTRSDHSVLAVKVKTTGDTIEGGWGDDWRNRLGSGAVRKEGVIEPHEIVDEHRVKTRRPKE